MKPATILVVVAILLLAHAVAAEADTVEGPQACPSAVTRALYAQPHEVCEEEAAQAPATEEAACDDCDVIVKTPEVACDSPESVYAVPSSRNPNEGDTMQSKTSKTRKAAKSKSQRRGAHKSNPTKNSASDTVKGIAQEVGVSYRRARRVARGIGLGVGKGQTYNTLTKAQVKKLTKALA